MSEWKPNKTWARRYLSAVQRTRLEYQENRHTQTTYSCVLCVVAEAKGTYFKDFCREGNCLWPILWGDTCHHAPCHSELKGGFDSDEISPQQKAAHIRRHNRWEGILEGFINGTIDLVFNGKKWLPK